MNADCIQKAKTSRKAAALFAMTILLALTVGLLTSCGDGKGDAITSLDQLNRPGTTIGVVSDTEEYRLIQEYFPQAEIVYTKDMMGSYISVAQGKLDAFIGNKLNMEMALYNGLKGVRVLDGSIGEGNVCAVALSPRTQIPDLKEKVNAFLKQAEEDGTLDDMRNRWMVEHDMTMPDIPEVKDPHCHLVVGTTGLSEPYTCYVDGELSGYDIELAKRFASWLGASFEFKLYDYEGIIPATEIGEIDCVFANLYVSSEREEAFEFSNPTYITEVGAIVRDTGSETDVTGFFNSVAESFNKTFMREGRWRLFVQGIATTLLMTALSILFGTLLGFFTFMACRKGNRAINAITRFSIWLIEGMPVVVLLMLLYYIVFGNTNLPGVAVSVIAFTLIFGASVFKMLKAGGLPPWVTPRWKLRTRSATRTGRPFSRSCCLKCCSAARRRTMPRSSP